MKKLENFTYRGQIMVIILLLLSVLTIIAVSVTLNTTRDTEQQVQDKQYQQYYSVGERNIIDMITYIEKQALSTAIPNNGLTPVYVTAGGLSYECTAPSANSRDCSLGSIGTSYFSQSGTAETLTTSMSIIDSNQIDPNMQVTVNKDQDILFDLQLLTGWSSLRFKWVDGGVNPGDYQVSWNISYDCYFAAANEYRTEKFVWDKSNGDNYSAVSTSGATAYFSVAWDNTTEFITVNDIGCGVGGTAQFLRVKAITKTSTTVIIDTLALGNAAVPLVRTIRTSTTTNNTGTQDVPSAVLETTYFLGETPLSLFDYVLRTEGDVQKTN